MNVSTQPNILFKHNLKPLLFFSPEFNDFSDKDKYYNDLIKKYKRALHLLRKVIRSFKKRIKQLTTFNPDIERLKKNIDAITP